jgi:hypothetical protein
MPENQPSTLDKLLAGLLSRDEFRLQVLDDVHSGLYQYCQIPAGYDNCELATRQIDLDALDDEAMAKLLENPPTEVVNPYPSQIKAVTLFNLLLSGDAIGCKAGDALQPSLGAYLYGPPGSGKTHLMAAYARELKRLLDDRLEEVDDIVNSFIDQAYLAFSNRIGTEREASIEEIGLYVLDGDEINAVSSPEVDFWQQIADLKERVAGYDYQPTDLIYIGFKELFEVCRDIDQRANAMHALERAKVVFIDDIHPQGDPEQVQLVLHLLERRYELGRAGTFLTTNLLARDLGGGDEMLGSRLISRCAETLVTVDFSDCDDWRQKVKSRRIKMVESELARRALTHRHRED